MTDTIVLIHGLWMTPRSWEHWVDYYGARGYRVLTPAYPGFEIEVEALRENPDVIANLTVPQTVDHLAGVIESLDAPPILMGHSFGGTLTQLLVARGLGSAAVVIDSCRSAHGSSIGMPPAIAASSPSVGAREAPSTVASSTSVSGVSSVSTGRKFVVNSAPTTTPMNSEL